MSTKTKTHKTMKAPKGYRAVKTGERIMAGDIFHDRDTGNGIEVKPHYCTVGEPYYGSGFLIRAVKHPAPAKKKAVKPKRDVWTYSEYSATLRKNGKAYAIVTPDGSNALELPKIQELLGLLNGGAK